MITKKDIIGFAEHISRRGKGVRDQQPILPVREWFTGLVLFMVLFFAGSGLAGYLFFVQLDALEAPIAVETDVVKYKQSLIADVLTTYRHRNAQFNDLREQSGLPVVVYDLASSTASTTEVQN